MRGRRLTVVAAGVGVVVCAYRYRRAVGNAVGACAAITVPVAFLATDFWDDITSPFSGIANDVKDFVKGLIRTAVNALHVITDAIQSGLNDLTGAVVGLAFSVARMAQSAVSTVAGVANGLIHDVWNYATGLFHQARDFAAGIVDHAVRWAQGEIQGLIDQLGWLQRWVVDNILHPLNVAIDYVWHHVVDPAFHFLQGLVADAKQWAMDAWHQVTGLVGKLWDFCFSWARGLLVVVEKCTAWLVMLAEHGPAWVVHQVQDAFRQAPEFLLHGLHAVVEQHGDEVEHLVSELIG